MKTIDERLKKLERSTRRWQVFGFLAIIALVYSMIGGAEGNRMNIPSSHPNPISMDNLKVDMPDVLSVDKLYASNISLRDSRGKERISLRMLDSGSPALIMRDIEGRAKSVWTISNDGRAQLAFRNDKSKDILLLSEHPKKDGGLVSVSNSIGKSVTAITTDAEGNGMIGVTKSDGSRPIGLGYW